MKISTIIASFLAIFCLVGCSDSPSTNLTLLVPSNAARVIKSPSYRLEHTTEGGIKCYVRPLVPDIARAISMDSPDFEYLKGDDINPYYLLVLIRNNKIIDKAAAEAGALSETDQAEIDSFLKSYVPPQVPSTNVVNKVEEAPTTNATPEDAPAPAAPAPDAPKTEENK